MADPVTETPRGAAALVDVLNVDPAASTSADYEDLVDLIASLVRNAFRGAATLGETLDVNCYLYGGFTDRNGGPTAQYSFLLRCYRSMASLQGGIRIVPHICVALACRPAAKLYGTYKNRGQKMVDQMLAQDAHYFASLDEYSELLVVGDDDDYLPALLATASQNTTPIKWLRRRSSTNNDQHFAGLAFKFLTDKEWVR